MKPLFLSFLFAFTLNACSQPSSSNVGNNFLLTAEKDTVNLSSLQTAYFAGGCFWCMEGAYELVKGVYEVESGYCGGDQKNPTYQDHSRGKVSHAETVKVYYDSSEVSFYNLLQIYFALVDPTQVNGQGPDWGESYRSLIFYQNESEKQQTQNFIDDIKRSGKYSQPLVVELKPFEKFWKAENYHQNFIMNNPNNPYVRAESLPRIQCAQIAFPKLIRPEKKVK